MQRLIVRWLSVFTLLSLSTVALALNVRFTLVQNSDGSFDTAYPTGNKAPSAATLAWDLSTLPSMLGLITTNSYSQDLNDCCLSGTSEATATLAIVDCSGDVAADNGWILSGSDPNQTLSNDGNDADLPGSGAFALRATESGDSALSECVNWSYVTAPSGDTTAPTVPVTLTTTAGTNQVTISWQSSTDVYDGEACSGLKHYLLRDDGVALSTVTSGVELGPCPQFTQTLVGGTNGTPANTQTGVDWSITGAGDGIDDTTDQFNFINATFAGNFVMHVKVNSLTSTASFPKAGLMARADNSTVGERYAFCGYQGNDKLIMYYRAALDGSRATALNQTQTAAVTLRLTRVSDLFSCDFSTNDGLTWTAGSSQTVLMPASIQVGLGVTAEETGTDATASFSEFGLSNIGTISQVHSTTVSSNYDVAAVDQDDNTTSYSGTVSGAPSAGGGGGEKKWHPGHYMQLLRNSDFSYNQSNRFAAYDGIASETDIEGVSWMARWSQLEGDIQGDYTAGIALLQAEIDHLKNLTVPKRLVLRIADVAYGDTCPSNEHPAYVHSNGWTNQAGNGCQWKRWNTGAMDAYIAMIEAYAAAFDDEPYFEAIHLTKETANNWGGSGKPSDYSDGAFDTQLRRLVSAASAAFAKTNVVLPVNWYNNSLAQSLYDHMVTEDAGHGNPDSCSTCNMDGDQYYTGTKGTTDYRGTIPAIMSVEVSSLGYNRVGDFTAQEVFNFIDGTINATHMLWDRNDIIGNANQRWDGLNGILDTIQNPANAISTTTCPTGYTQGCDTG